MTRRCVCPGSFDPVTTGHLDVIARSLSLFDETVVAVLLNPGKRGRFAAEDRVDMIREAVREQGLPQDRVSVEAFTGRLLVDVAAAVDACAIVKGLRGETDYAYELPMALMNRELSGIETVLLPGDPALGHVSSSRVTEVAAGGADISGMVPDAVLRRMTATDGYTGGSVS